MNPQVESVRPRDDYDLEVRFTNGEWCWFDVKPYLAVASSCGCVT